MKLVFSRLYTSGAALVASLVLVAAAAQAADLVAMEDENVGSVEAQLPEVPSVPPVLVHRGSASEAVKFDAAPEPESHGVQVLRGTTEPDEPPAAEIPALPQPQAQLWASSGRDLWFYNPEGETLRACRLFKGQYVERYKIRCFERDLQ